MNKPTLKTLGAIFSPNAAISKTVTLMIVVTQVALALALWFFTTSPVIPRPPEIVSAFGKLWTEGLLQDLLISFITNLEALALTVVISLVLSYLTVLPVIRPIALFISKGRFLGMVGLTFVFTIAIGGGHQLKVALMTFGMTVFFVTSMAAVVAEIPSAQFDHARTMRMSEWRAVWEIVVLGQADKAFEVLRQNAAIGWMMLTMVEGVVRSEGGIGTTLLNQNKHFALAAVFAVQIMILLIGVIQDYLIGALKHICCPYASLTLERK